ncbi:hypothetical protein E4U42_005468 [Claviceps africana]|uniref:Uncharacterized protein n=1 Tax=Claviceps africana TaxID=83212 RepID=A0A8K0NNZ3_9HYPO|nr:hypothetical protein E4U42_005468 [Claviceps africana]
MAQQLEKCFSACSTLYDYVIGLKAVALAPASHWNAASHVKKHPDICPGVGRSTLLALASDLRVADDVKNGASQSQRYKNCGLWKTWDSDAR